MNNSTVKLTIIFYHISISKFSSPAHLVITPVLAVEVFISFYTVLKCNYLHVFPFMHFLLQCYTMPLMVSGNFLSSLMISQLECCHVFSFFEMQYLGRVSRMGLLEAAGVIPLHFWAWPFSRNSWTGWGVNDIEKKTSLTKVYMALSVKKVVFFLNTEGKTSVKIHQNDMKICNFFQNRCLHDIYLRMKMAILLDE